MDILGVGGAWCWCGREHVKAGQVYRTGSGVNPRWFWHGGGWYVAAGLLVLDSGLWWENRAWFLIFSVFDSLFVILFRILERSNKPCTHIIPSGRGGWNNLKNIDVKIHGEQLVVPHRACPGVTKSPWPLDYHHTTRVSGGMWESLSSLAPVPGPVEKPERGYIVRPRPSPSTRRPPRHRGTVTRSTIFASAVGPGGHPPLPRLAARRLSADT